MPDQNFAYPFDPTGTASSNFIEHEQHVISPPDYTDFYFVVPTVGPFFRENLLIKHYPSGQVLVEGVDYVLAYRFVSASRATAKALYGAISIMSYELSGALEISYQTLGGDYTIDDVTLAQKLADTTVNPRITTWEQITELPQQFPVIDHEWDLVDLVGASDLQDAIDRVTDAIYDAADGGGGSGGGHTTNFSNPHNVTKAQVGLSEVQNYPIASELNASDESNNLTYMTPRRTHQAIVGSIGVLFDDHVADQTNPHRVTKAQVGLGNVENHALATPEAATEGISNELSMTPYLVRLAINGRVNDVIDDRFAALAGHVEDRDNPHQVTKAQVGLGNVDDYAMASLAEAESGGLNTRFMSPQRTSQAIAAQALAPLTAHANDQTNPHQVTKDQVGLSDVVNQPMASSAEAEEGTATDRYVSPRDVSLRLDKVLDDHIAKDSDRLGGLSLGEVTDTVLTPVAQTFADYDVRLGAIPDDVLGQVEALYSPRLDTHGDRITIVEDAVSNFGADVDTTIATALQVHTDRTDNPHQVTKDQVNLGSVENLRLATDAEATAGTSHNAYMTPLRTKEAINALSGDAVTTHTSDTDNPHNVTKFQVGLGDVENYTLASKSEAEVGSMSNRYMSPLRTKEAIDALIGNDFNSHAADQTNPHAVTKAQVGLGSVEDYGIASTVEATDATSNLAYMTPLRTKEAIDSIVANAFTAHAADQENPHGVTKTHVGLGDVLNYGVADEVDALLGTSNAKYMTPVRTQQAIDNRVGTAFNDHAANQNNPHNVTLSQLGGMAETDIVAALLGKLDATATAANSELLSGFTLAQITNDIAAETLGRIDVQAVIPGQTGGTEVWQEVGLRTFSLSEWGELTTAVGNTPFSFIATVDSNSFGTEDPYTAIVTVAPGRTSGAWKITETQVSGRTQRLFGISVDPTLREVRLWRRLPPDTGTMSITKLTVSNTFVFYAGPTQETRPFPAPATEGTPSIVDMSDSLDALVEELNTWVASFDQPIVNYVLNDPTSSGLTEQDLQDNTTTSLSAGNFNVDVDLDVVAGAATVESIRIQSGSIDVSSAQGERAFGHSEALSNYDGTVVITVTLS